MGKRICHLNSPVTSKMMSRSPKPNQLLSFSKLCIQANLVEVHQLVQEISWAQDFHADADADADANADTDADTNGIRTETNMSNLTFGGGHYDHD